MYILNPLCKKKDIKMIEYLKKKHATKSQVYIRMIVENTSNQFKIAKPDH